MCCVGVANGFVACGYINNYNLSTFVVLRIRREPHLHKEENYNMVEALFGIFLQKGIKLLRRFTLERKTTTTREFIVLQGE